jgi:lipopolysaccharide export system permease protein
MWRLALPLAALNLALLAIPLGAVNPRMGRSGNILVAGLVGLLYMNLINLSRGWIRNGQLGFEIGLWLVHAIFLLIMVFMMWRKLRIKAPKPPATS